MLVISVPTSRDKQRTKILYPILRRTPRPLDLTSETIVQTTIETFGSGIVFKSFQLLTQLPMGPNNTATTDYLIATGVVARF